MRAHVTLLNRRWGALCACAALLCLGACRRPSALSDYAALAGRISLVRADTLELTVQPAGAFRSEAAGSVMCLLTRDSELYINDRLADLGELQLGDQVELVGHYQKEPPEKRFVVATGHVARSEPPPPSLAASLPPPSTQPATSESQSKAPS